MIGGMMNKEDLENTVSYLICIVRDLYDRRYLNYYSLSLKKRNLFLSKGLRFLNEFKDVYYE